MGFYCVTIPWKCSYFSFYPCDFQHPAQSPRCCLHIFEGSDHNTHQGQIRRISPWPPGHSTPPRRRFPRRSWLGKKSQKHVCLKILRSQSWRGDSPIIGRLSSVEGRMSFRISSKTEMDNRMVILKPSFSPRASLMKKEAKSRTNR